jgi:hypothetical protein
MTKKYANLLLITCLLFPVLLAGQPRPEWTLTLEEVQHYKEQSRMLVQYFEGTLNFLGDPNSTVKEKEIIIHQSYDKIFVNERVQVEDDLDENRDVPVNKDVQAYLKDVDFFFRSAIFRFEIQSIEPMVNENGYIFFRVTLNRMLNAKTISGDTIRSSRLRFIEINLDPFKKDLRIASYYTTKLNEREELRNWWAMMDSEWKHFFGANLMIFDSIPMSDVMAVLSEGVVVNRMRSHARKGTFYVVGKDTIPELLKSRLAGRRPDEVLNLNDVVQRPKKDTIKKSPTEADNRLRQLSQIREVILPEGQGFRHLEPLAQLSMLETIQISGTAISDLSPLRNLSRLTSLNISSTPVTDLSPLQYVINLKELYCNDTRISNIEVVANFPLLERLYINNSAVSDLGALEFADNLMILRASRTNISSLQPLSRLKMLRILDVSRTAVNDLSPLKLNTQLQQINLDNTAVSSLDALRGFLLLNTVQFSQTNVSDLSPLQQLPELRRVYSDNNKVSPAMATAFMRNRPGVLVVFDSEELRLWWNQLPVYWRALLVEQSGISRNPGTEELHQLINLEKLDLAGNRYLKDMQPVSRLYNLQQLSIADTEITDIQPLVALSDLKKLDISNTRISDLSALSQLFQLQELNIENTQVSTLQQLKGIQSLKLILADGSQLKRENVLQLKDTLSQTLVIYQTKALRFWWNNLSEEWKDILSGKLPLGLNPTPQQLQMIADQSEVEVVNNLSISTIEPLSELLMIERLVLTGTNITDLSPLQQLNRLRHLNLSGNPLSNIRTIGMLGRLEYLNIASTPVSDISAIAQLSKLKQLDLSGTQVRSLRALASLNELEELSVFNTRLRSLSPADRLPALRHLKCYNTRISRKNIEKLRVIRPDMNILYY